MASRILHLETEVNLIITGPPKTGKKTFIRALTNNSIEIPESTEDISPVYDMSFDVYGKSFKATVWYVRNLENSVEEIKLICQNKNSSTVVLFWFAINDPQSLTSLSKDYITKLRQKGRFHFLSLLVGGKVDLRLDGFGPCACRQDLQGQLVKNCFHLGDFVECSAKIEQSVRNVFIKAVFIALGVEDD